ncbi:glycosyltransferase family 2 protein [Pseudomonas sp. SWRI111]|uniref:glycosyltransferase family 2 protein n=1 Tax=Pseudomonas sp. SWRI111 TaxID=2745507 RepID=UPI0016457B91|nr:glycosyltransferase family 2 protein [Pseudomonas sp. SWRI111]MBC3207670.1 glycosyltransferase family 2 protein [Pseudomonas sp. SWRI111]
MKLSIVSTLYRSTPFLEEFHGRVSGAAREIAGDDYEIILVNDGSPDHSLQMALQLQGNDSHLQIVDLSRNFGHHAAIVAGLENTRGDHVFLLDCDLEEQPEWLAMFVDKMRESKADVVYGVQQERVASPVSNLLGEAFWTSLNFMSNVRIPHNPMTCRLMTRQYVDSLMSIGDRVLYLAGVFAWAGFTQEPLALKKTPRPNTHKSTYSLSKKLLQVADSFSSFSVAPLSLIFSTGLLIWLGSLIYGLFLLIQKLINPEIVLSGFTSVMLSLWFLGGTIILFLGILGLYVAKIFNEVKRRPLYLVRNVYKGNQNDQPS